jgi:hypothetical protein
MAGAPLVPINSIGGIVSTFISLGRTSARTALVVVLSVFSFAAAPMAATADDTLPLPWPLPGSPPLPPDYTVPYLPGVNTICADGHFGCWNDLLVLLRQKRASLGCDHEAIAADAYVTITEGLKQRTADGFWSRPRRLTHEARQYAQEYLDQSTRWHSGNTATVAPVWQVALQAMQDRTQTGVGDLLLWLNAHIRRDNPIRAIEQSEGVLRTDGLMPAASGRPDHDRVSDALQDLLVPMLSHNAAFYDPTADDAVELFGMVMDPKGLYALISSWREEAWRNAEQLRHARAAGGVNGTAYQAKLAEINQAALAGAEFIKAATLATPDQTAARDAYCASHVGSLDN